MTLRVPSERTGSVARCYSLCSSPFTDDALTVTVKRTADGYASNWLCDNARPGMRIHVLAPSGNFVPKTLGDDFLLMAAGSGITPIMSIAKSALSEGSGQVTLLYANRDERSVIFADAARAVRQISRPAHRAALAGIAAGPAQRDRAGPAGRPYTDRPVYICGPGAFMDSAREALETLKVPAAQIHIEVFKSLDSDPFAAVKIEDTAEGDEPPATAVVELDGETHTVSWPRNAKLLDVLLAKGLDAPFSCREGHCGACACTLRKGQVSMEVNDVLEQQGLDEGLILACQSHPESDSVEVTYDE